MMKHRSPFALSLVILMACLLISACTPGTQASIPPTEPVDPTPAVNEPSQASPTPSLPAPQARILFVTGNESSAQVEEIKAKLNEIATQNNLLLESTQGLDPAQLDASARLVVFLSVPEGLESLLASAPDQQFLVISQAEINPAANLSTIRVQPSDRAFLAGMITAMLSPDWRSGGLFPTEQPEIAGAFQNGGHYLCGRCVPVYAPVVFFPVTGGTAAGSPPVAWQGAFDELQKNRLEALYISPEAQSPELLQSLSDKGIILLGGQAPGDAKPASWAVTLQM
jgi:hypothetical protein